MTQESVESSPLTPLQLGMLHESLLSDRAGVNLVQIACHLDDETFDPFAMKASWEALTRRHAVLRSVYAWKEDRAPSQDVMPDAQFEFLVHDLQSLGPSQQHEALKAWTDSDRTRGVRLDMVPSWRLAWFRWEGRRSTLCWTFHHIMLDGRSFALLLQEVLEEYCARLRGEIPEPTLLSPLGFAGYCHALESLRHSEDAQNAARGFFETELQGVAADLTSEALARHESPAGHTPGRMACSRALVSISEVERLQALAQASGATLGTLLQVAWGILLSRARGQRDAVFGVVRSGRHLVPGAQATIGCLINTLPVRLKVDMGASIDQLLRDIRRYMLGMRPHEHVFLGDLQAWNGVFADEGGLNSIVMFEPRPLDRQLRSLGGPWLQRRFEVHEEGATEMTLAAYVEDGLQLELEYDSNRVEAQAAQRLLSFLHTLLGQMAQAKSDQTVASLDMLGPEDRNRLQGWAVPAIEVQTSATCAMALFTKTARRQPSAVAISVLGHRATLTYAELDARSSQLAHWLRNQAVEAGDRVAICMTRSLDFVVAMLAVMKAGAAHVPIDPAYPAELKHHMASDSGATVLLADTHGAALPTIARTVVLKALSQELATLPIEWSDPQGQARDRPAYVIYTSGSTGQPKGVTVGQRALVAHSAAVTAAYGLTENDRVLQFASLSFDVSIEEIIPTLLTGAELVLRDTSVAESVSALWAAAQERQLTVLNLPTAYWHTCVDHLEQMTSQIPACVRLVVVGGEKASRQALARWRKAVPSCRWINGYGPTEATITSTFYEALDTQYLPEQAEIPIGRPMGHARAYVVAADGSLAPPGVRGELCLGGACLAIGYHGQQELTSQRFMSTSGLDPLWAQTLEARVYRTGDLVSWNADGELLYHGRADRQVKLRGFRVELDAVEKVLTRLPGVGRAVVKVDQPNTPAARLLAWVLPAQPGQLLEVAALNAVVATQLPEHMRPALSVIENLPITPGGKIDYRLLIGGDVTELVSTGTAAELPISEELQRMTDVFARVLKRSKVMPDASFFDLGGNSLLAVGLIGRVESEFHHRMTTGLLKANPTPRALLDTFADGSHLKRPKYLIAIQPEGHRTPIYGVHSLGHQERFFRPLSESLGADQPFFGLTTGYTSLHGADLSLEELARVYLEDIQHHQPEGPVVLAGLSRCAYVAYELAGQLTNAGRTVSLLVFFDSAGPAGRPEITNRRRLLAIHLSQLREQGWRYGVDKLVGRLSEVGGTVGNWALRTGRAHGVLDNQQYDHPADILFVQQLERAVAKYQVLPYEGPVAIFYPEDDPFLDRKAALATGLGWRVCCTGDIELVESPGQHISMLSNPYVVALARALKARFA